MFRKAKGTVWNTTRSINYRWYMGFFCYLKQTFRKNCFHLEFFIRRVPKRLLLQLRSYESQCPTNAGFVFLKMHFDEPTDIEESGDE